MNLIHLHINSISNLISDLFQDFPFSGGVGLVGGLGKIENLIVEGVGYQIAFFFPFLTMKTTSLGTVH